MPTGLSEFIHIFLRERGLEIDDININRLKGDGSTRIFWKLTPYNHGTGYITMENPPLDELLSRENFAYLMIGKHLRKKGIPMPEIHRYDLDHGWFIMEDMGQSLQEYISEISDPLPVYKKVIEELIKLQVCGAEDFKPEWCCQTERYDLTVMRKYESDYFRDAFLCNFLGLKKKWPELDSPFNHLAETASKMDSRYFLHRDFQSRNIMILDGDIGIIDWQDGRLGPPGYDLASLLIDPYSSLSSRRKNELFNYYLSIIKGYDGKWRDSFKRYFPYLAIQRNLQILGAFSFLTLIKNKHYFSDYIPKALQTLHELLISVNDPFLSPLNDLIDDILSHNNSLDIPIHKK